MILIGIIALLVLVNIITIINVVAGPFLRNYYRPAGTPLVSVLIPARNEEKNISDCLSTLQTQTYSRFEVIVLDDHSSDATHKIAKAFAASDDRMKVIRGKELPPGWTGKNWACSQLSKKAKGKILLFMDADVRPGPAAIENTVAAFERFKASGVSAFPRQRFSNRAAEIVVPLMDVLLYGALPLRAVKIRRFSSLLAANGQWLAFTSEAYQSIGTHAAVRMEIVEDMALARRVKHEGLRFVVTSGVGAVECSMYDAWKDLVGGFSKNFFAAFGFRPSAFIAVLSVIFVLAVLPFVALALSFPLYAVVAVALNYAFRFMMSARFGHGILTAVLHPLGALAAIVIGLNALRLYYFHGEVHWKDRPIVVR
jgi:chlorobactene glucosyltransferase